MWKALDDEEREKYDDIFEKQEAKYKEDLILYYGGTDRDIRKYKSLLQIPPRPRKPINSSLAYIHENRREYAATHPDMEPSQVTKALADRY